MITTGSNTVTVAVPDTPLLAVAVIVAVPAANPNTIPASVTVATLASLVEYLIVLSLASAGRIVTAVGTDLPFSTEYEALANATDVTAPAASAAFLAFS